MQGQLEVDRLETIVPLVAAGVIGLDQARTAPELERAGDLVRMSSRAPARSCGVVARWMSMAIPIR